MECLGAAVVLEQCVCETSINSPVNNNTLIEGFFFLRKEKSRKRREGDAHLRTEVGRERSRQSLERVTSHRHEVQGGT